MPNPEVEVRPDMNFKGKSQRSNDCSDLFLILAEVTLQFRNLEVPGESNLRERNGKEGKDRWHRWIVASHMPCWKCAGAENLISRTGLHPEVLH